ncbi:MAG: hypothetical protein SVT56_03330 [Chloroflexota bacterium]|nr:hypothetical protein [Chloroflexota bacterium]
MKKLTLFSLLLLAVLLSGCNFPGYEGFGPEDSDDSMATEIAKILTGTPGEVVIPPTSEDVEQQLTNTPVSEDTETAVSDTATPVATTATPTPTATTTLTSTATLSDTDPALTLGDPDWVDTMDDGDNWPTGYNDYTSIDFDDGYLKLTAETAIDGWRLSWPYLDDSYMEVKLQSPNCEGNDHFGLMFRVPVIHDANQGYLFGITCDGKYSLRLWNEPNMAFPISWTSSAAINTGKNVQNTIGVMARDETLTLYINGQKVDEVTNEVFLEGGFGIFVGGTNVSDPSVWVDQIRYWENP